MFSIIREKKLISAARLTLVITSLNNRARFYIHFKTPGGQKNMRAFSYDWRMWTIPELRDLMIDAGFRDVLVYWEGTAADGSGNGKYHRRKTGDSSQAWIAYIVGCV